MVLCYVMYGYTLEASMNQKCAQQAQEELQYIGHKQFMTHKVLKSRRSKMRAMHNE